MAERHVTVNLTVGEPELGLWCETCALPSLVEFPIYAITEQGVTQMGAVPLCTEHGRGD